MNFNFHTRKQKSPTHSYDSLRSAPKTTIFEIIRWRSISMRAGPAVLQFDWSKAGLSMDLPVFVYSYTKTASSSFKTGKI